MALETHYPVFSSRNPPSIIGPSRSNLRASTSLRFGALLALAHATARAPCEPVPCGVDHDLHILRYPVLAPLAYTLRRPTSGVDMRTDGNARWHSFDAERACVSWRRSMRTICTRGAPFLPTILPAATYFPALAARFLLRALAPYTHRRGAHFVTDTPTLFHFRCATQLSNAPCAEFSACRNLDGYEAAAGAYMDLEDHRPSLSTTRFAPPFVILAIVVLPPLSPLFLCARPPPQPAATRAPFGRTSSLPPPTPPLPPSPPPATCAAPQHKHRDAAHEGAPEAQAQHYEDYGARFPSSTTAPPALRSKHFPAWEGFRFAGRTRRSCVAVPRLPVDARTSTHLSLTRPTCCAVVSSALSALPLRRAGEEKAKYAFPLTGVFVSLPSSVRAVSDGRLSPYFTSRFSTISLYLPADDISTSSISPCTARVIVVCSWLLLVVLELVVGGGMWLCYATIIFTTFLYRRYFFSTRANSLTTRSRKCHRRPRRMLSHFLPAQTILIRRRCAGAAGSSAQAAGFETTGTEISLLLASRSLRAFLFTVPLYSFIPISPLEDEIMKAEIGYELYVRPMIRANGYTRPQSCVAVDLGVVPDKITSRNLSGPAEALSPQSGLRFLVPLFRLDSVEPYQRARNLGP
ncbi:hypothetical protein B0H14DRAFT_3874688 [Mycena olivaceomarginata]|nr:hypothetical protein B0H14DRAFT_3874688 [Mycena olivaceomarginata]